MGIWFLKPVELLRTLPTCIRIYRTSTDMYMKPNDHYLCFCAFFFFAPTAHMWFDNKIFEADTTEDQSGSPMEKVPKKITCSYLL